MAFILQKKVFNLRLSKMGEDDMQNIEQITARNLHVFSTLMTSHGLKEAALKLNCSMAAVSKTIHHIEQVIGLRLFERVGGRLQATDVAYQILPSIQRGLQQLDLARYALFGLEAQKKHLRIGVGGGALAALVPQAMNLFLEIHPSVQLDLVSKSTQELLNLISNHQLDLAICTPAPQDIAPEILALCHIEEIAETALIAAVHQSDPLSEKNLVTPQDLVGKKLITIYPNSPTTVMLKAAFREAHVEPNFAMSVSNSMSACYLIHAQLGVGFIHPEVLNPHIFPDIKRLRFSPRISMRTYIYMPKNKQNSPFVELFIKLIKAVQNDQRDFYK